MMHTSTIGYTLSQAYTAPVGSMTPIAFYVTLCLTFTHILTPKN